MLDKSIKLEHLQRVNVIGTSCSGKTTFAKNLAQALNVKHIELDAIYWLPDWIERPNDEFRNLVEKEVAADVWVLTSFHRHRRDYPRLLQEIQNEDRKILVFHNPKQTDEFLKKIRQIKTIKN